MFDLSKQKFDLDIEKSVDDVKKNDHLEDDEKIKKCEKKLEKKQVKTKSDSESDMDFPSLFKNKIFFINSDVENQSELKRYIRT